MAENLRQGLRPAVWTARPHQAGAPAWGVGGSLSSRPPEYTPAWGRFLPVLQGLGALTQSAHRNSTSPQFILHSVDVVVWVFKCEGNSVGVWRWGSCEVSAEVRISAPGEEIGSHLLSEWMSEKASQ